MAGRARDRQRAARTARSRAEAAALAAARRSQRLRKTIAIVAVLGILATLVVVFVAALGGDDETVVAGDATSTTNLTPTTPSTEPIESAAGKPCVAVSEALPAGAPDVPVQEGPAPTELVVTDLVSGTGATVGETDTLTVDYIGVSCSTGAIFDSSYERGQPATFSLSGVIPGWTQGLAGMQVGGRRLLGIPPDLAYGEFGSPPDIAPDETLWFVVDVLEATPAG